MGKKFDFSGWATRANLLCSDGRVIQKDAFEECDGKKVPLIWNHRHGEPDAVLGHAVLENRDDGVYAYCTFNDTDAGQNAKLLVQHGDVEQLSIYANKLRHRGRDVIHGIIREVSLVLAGANPGARIESVIMHSDDSCEEGFIYTGEYIENIDMDSLSHADSEKKESEEKGDSEMAEKQTKGSDDKTIAEVLETFTEEQKKVLYALVGQALEEQDNEDKSEDESKKEVKHAATEEKEKTVADVLDSMTEEQKTVMYALIGQALEEDADDMDDEDDDSAVKHSDIEGGNYTMKRNVFDKETEMNDVLTHSEMEEIISEARRNGSLADTFLQHGITNVDYLFPDAKTIDSTPGFLKRDDSWVAEFMGAVHKTPFSRIKSIFADITEADARAKGYVKGREKVDEVFSLLKRVTTPTTIYKKQSIDRDDVVDITDLDVIAWLKTEMRMMLDEEIARAALVGDGRQNSSNDKINEQNVRPIWTDDDKYTIKVGIPITKATTDEEKAKGFITGCIKSRKNYKGSGNPTMYISEDMLTNCLLLEDKNGRVIYDTVDKLATALRVKKIVPVPVMDGLTRVVSDKTHELAGIYVNPDDYNIGADKGGAVNMFDDFDIDYNKQKYLIETRCSGALIKLYAAAAIETVIATSELGE